MGLPCSVRVNYRGYAVAVHRRLCYPHVTSAAVVHWGFPRNWEVKNELTDDSLTNPDRDAGVPPP